MRLQWRHNTAQSPNYNSTILLKTYFVLGYHSRYNKLVRRLSDTKKIRKTDMNNIDQQFLEYVVKALVDNPNDVKIVRTVDEMGVLMTLEVNGADMGKVIGRSGNTAKAIRTLLRVVGMKNNSRVNLKINEPEGSMKPASEKTTKTVDEAMADLNI